MLGSSASPSEGTIDALAAAWVGMVECFAAGTRVAGCFLTVADLAARKVAAYFESDRVTKTRAGKPAAKPGVDKTRRALRMALEWAVAAGWASANPAGGVA